MEIYIGTNDLVGATITADNWDNFHLEKDGRHFILRYEIDWGYCYCYDYDPNGRCTCTPTINFRAVEEVADPPKKVRKSKAK